MVKNVILNEDLNTSYVAVKRELNGNKCVALVNLNTSYVAVKDPQLLTAPLSKFI